MGILLIFGFYLCVDIIYGSIPVSNPNSIKQNIEYMSDVYNMDRRRLSDNNDDNIYRNIRITPYFGGIESELNDDNKYTIDIIKNQVSSAIRYYERIISIIPVKHPLRLTRECTMDGYTRNGEIIYDCDTTCGSSNFIIPDQHLSAGYIFNETNNLIFINETGVGVADTDLILYVTNDNDKCIGKAWSMVCEQDQHGRPIGILLNFCHETLNDINKDNDFTNGMNLVLHELTHGLIMNDDFWDDFKYSNGDPMPRSSVYGYFGDNDTPFIITPKVKEITYNHFRCNQLPGAMMGENRYHWHARMFNTELMSDNHNYVYLSNFTLALMEDSGWYKIDYNYAQPFSFGQYRGCSFINNDCINKEYFTSTYYEFWCDDPNEQGCLYDYNMILNECLISNDYVGIPYSLQYFGNQYVGGQKETDYCPVFNVSNNQMCSNKNEVPYSYKQIKTNNGDIINDKFGYSNSKCVNVLKGSSRLGYCFNIECESYNSYTNEYQSVLINVGNTAVRCTRDDEGGFKQILTIDDGDEFSIRCPMIDVMCQGKEALFCYFGHWNNKLNKCICNAGYKGSKCNELDYGIETLQLGDGHDLPPKPDKRYYSKLCAKGALLVDDLNGDFIHNEEYNFNLFPTYIRCNSDNSICFEILFWAYNKKWVINMAMNGITAVIASCDAAMFDDMANIVLCNGNWIIWDNEEESHRNKDLIFNKGSCDKPVYPDQPQYICLKDITDETNISGYERYILPYLGSYRFWGYDDTNFPIFEKQNLLMYYSHDYNEWRIYKDVSNSTNDWYLKCETRNILDCVGTPDHTSTDDIGWESPKLGMDWSLHIKYGHCDDTDIYTPEPTTSVYTIKPTNNPTIRTSKSPTIKADHYNNVCIMNSGNTLDGEYNWDGTFNNHAVYKKAYLPELNRPFIYLFYGDNSWTLYRKKNNDYYYLKCDTNTDTPSKCNGKWSTSWSGLNDKIIIIEGPCQEIDLGNNIDTSNNDNNNNNVNTSAVVYTDEAHNHYDFVCISGIESIGHQLDGSYEFDDEHSPYNGRPVYKKEYYPELDNPYVYLKFEQSSKRNVSQWVLYRKLHTDLYFVLCDESIKNEDVTACSTHLSTSWNGENANILINAHQCVTDTTTVDTNANVETKGKNNTVIENEDDTCDTKPVPESSNFIKSFCLYVDDEYLFGEYKIDGILNDYPYYKKEYRNDESKPYVYIKWINGTWILYRKLCNEDVYYMYTDDETLSTNPADMNGKWITSWNGFDSNIIMEEGKCEIILNETIIQQYQNYACVKGTESFNGDYKYLRDYKNYPFYYKKINNDNVNDNVCLYYSGLSWVINGECKIEGTNIEINDTSKTMHTCNENIISVDVSLCDEKWDNDNIRTSLGKCDYNNINLFDEDAFDKHMHVWIIHAIWICITIAIGLFCCCALYNALKRRGYGKVMYDHDIETDNEDGTTTGIDDDNEYNTDDDINDNDNDIKTFKDKDIIKRKSSINNTQNGPKKHLNPFDNAIVDPNDIQGISPHSQL